MVEEASAQAHGGDEEVVVDNVDTAPIVLGTKDIDAPRDFVVEPQQLLSLDQAILQSIDRCRKYQASNNFNEKIYPNFIF